MKRISEFVYVGVVLMDNLACNSVMERSKRTFLNEHNSIYQKFSNVDTNIRLYLFKMHAMSFDGIKTWFMK